MSPENHITIVISANNRADRSATGAVHAERRASATIGARADSDGDDLKQKSQSSNHNNSLWLCYRHRRKMTELGGEIFLNSENVRVINAAFKINANGGKKPSSEACFDKLSSCHSDQTLWFLMSGRQRERAREREHCDKMLKNKHFHPRFQMETPNCSWLAGPWRGSCLKTLNYWAAFTVQLQDFTLFFFSF